MRLSILSAYGCFDETEKIVTIVGEMLVNVPNSFTPNGDGINDMFEPMIFGAKDEDFSFIVFDRWGEILYESSSLDSKAWDGNFKGKLVKDGQYVYKVVARSAYSDKIEEYQGTVRVLR